MLEEVTINCHSSIKIANDQIIYIDPFNIQLDLHDADYIFITHSHYDHFSLEDIVKILKKDTIFITVPETKLKLESIGIEEKQIITVKPNNTYNLGKISFNTVPAYNANKKFHPKENEWVGYIIESNETKYYIAGDTDYLQELEQINCDVAFLPIGGTYTMNAKEAANLANVINAKTIVPIHYGEIVGTKKDLEEFIKNTKKEVVTLIEK